MQRDLNIAAFVEAQRAARLRAGLPATITDPTSLRLFAAVVAGRGGDVSGSNAAA